LEVDAPANFSFLKNKVTFPQEKKVMLPGRKRLEEKGPCREGKSPLEGGEGMEELRRI